MSISVRYIYSACVVIKTEDITILCDPWFTQGVIDGSWFHFPLIEDPLNVIGDVDIVWISHIHHDHYDPEFLEKYFDRYGKKEIIICDFKRNYIQRKMLGEGFNPTLINEEGKIIGKTKLNIFAHDTGSIGDIDSALVVEYKSNSKTHVVLNLNDIPADEKFLSKINKFSPKIDILLLGYAGAGAYPQTYFDLQDHRLIQEASKKKNQFLNMYLKIISKLNSKVNIPFAGQYLLGGKLTELNDFRGVADAVEVLDIDDNAIVMDDGGASVINTKDLIPSSVRLKKYSRKDLQRRFNEIKNAKMHYEKLMNEDHVDMLPILRLLPKAYNNAIKFSEVKEDYYFYIHIDDIGVLMNCNMNNHSYKVLKHSENLPTPRTEIFINKIYLFGLLTMIYHWNNAEGGSQYMSRRFPFYAYNMHAQTFLSFLHI
jgi:UDP-MurNAc hydroxylase